MATTIPQRDLRNDVSAVLRRVEAGEEFIVTVSGRPVAELRPLGGGRTGLVSDFVAGLLPVTEADKSALAALDEELGQLDAQEDDRDPWERWA